jgi:hypothetical protein
MVKSASQVGVAFLLRKSASHLGGALCNLASQFVKRFHKNPFQIIKVFKPLQTILRLFLSTHQKGQTRMHWD